MADGFWWIIFVLCFVFFKQKTAYEMRISDWSSDVCSSDLDVLAEALIERRAPRHELKAQPFVDHREAARRKRHPLPVDAADIVACARRFVLKSCEIGRASCRERVCQYV